MTSPPSGGRAGENQSFPGRPNSAPTGHATGSAHAGLVNINYVNELSQPVSKTALEEFVRKSFIVYDEQANFALDWTQAAHHDEEIKLNGMKRHLQMCGALGRAWGQSRGGPFEAPVVQGLALFSQPERAWSYCGLYGDKVPEAATQRAVAAHLGGVPKPPATDPLDRKTS